jgi:hypothetical protein
MMMMPKTWLLAAALITPFAGCGVWLMALIFLLIDRRDEFQLVTS